MAVYAFTFFGYITATLASYFIGSDKEDNPQLRRIHMVEPHTIYRYLSGISYPVTKQELINNLEIKIREAKLSLVLMKERNKKAWDLMSEKVLNMN